uniref:MD-2-related lipid-recognition domain-containing protein n=1 Tax=Stomoxys calcitrans TaxID=35570 RepID=A0A1I8PQI8_STOCA
MILQRMFVTLCGILATTQAAVRFTNWKCTSFDESYVTFPICILKVVRRGVISANVYAAIHKSNLNNVSVNLGLYKKENGYRPFLYNITLDFCKFIKTRKSFPFFRMFFDTFRKNSNINHSCPYNHDIIVENYTLSDEMFKLLPLPEGEYMFKLLVGTYNVWKADISGYILKNDKIGRI